MFEWMILPLKRYADFQGRSRRREYWFFALLMLICYLLIGAIFGGFDVMNYRYGFGGGWTASNIVMMLFWLAVLIPSIAVVVRRFHDQDRSGWFALLGLIPYVGGLVILVFMLFEGTRGPNRFGPDPKAGEPHGAA